MLRYICLLTVFLGVKTSVAPFIKPCKNADTACVLQSAQAALPYVAPGIPELGVPSLDPMHLPLINGDQGGLRLTFTDTILTGMKGCAVDAIKQDMTKKKQTVTIRCSVVLKGHYKLGGQLLVLPVTGDGEYTIKIRDIIIKTITEIETVQGSDGKPHWHIADWRHSYQVKTGTEFHFDNMFNGNQLLAGPVDTFVNSNWREVMKEIAPPIVRAIVAAVVDGVEAVYKAVPADELTIQ